MHDEIFHKVREFSIEKQKTDFIIVFGSYAKGLTLSSMERVFQIAALTQCIQLASYIVSPSLNIIQYEIRFFIKYVDIVLFIGIPLNIRPY